jgi:ABC-type transport system substrate-binding protein
MNAVPDSKQEVAYNNGPEAVSQEPWDFILIGLSGSLLTPSLSDVVYSSHGGMNFFGYSSSDVDALFKRAKSNESLDKTARGKIYADLSRVLSEEQPVDFLVFNRANVGFQKNVTGIEPGINMGYNYYMWRFEPVK